MDSFNWRTGTALGYPSSQRKSEGRERHGRAHGPSATRRTSLHKDSHNYVPLIIHTNKATGKIRGFFMAILKPIKSSMTTNMQVIQTSVLLKYRPLYAFLQRRAANVALEFQKSYIAAARVYYETGFRRYTRSLSWIKVNPRESLTFFRLIIQCFHTFRRERSRSPRLLWPLRRYRPLTCRGWSTLESMDLGSPWHT